MTIFNLNKKAFSLIELMISLIVISCITAAFAPVVTKKLKNSSVSVSMNASSNECKTTECETGYYLENSSCECKTCSNKFLNCIECNSEKCTKCNTPYAPNTEGRCEECSDDTISDGTQCLLKSVCDNPPEGYFCDGNVMRRCVDKYSNYCKTCNSSSCLSCSSSTYLSGGDCKACLQYCMECTNSTTCTKCNSDRILSAAKDNCSVSCINQIANCLYCSSASICKTCVGQYYLNSSKTCTSCSTISNCITCTNASTCTKCNTGYYVNSSNSCSQCTVANCAQCDTDGTCASCNQGYHLAEDRKSCLDNENKFNCSDSNFMQIGNLCVTRKNMGDSLTLKIPSSVNVVEAGSEYCYSQSEKCCWKGTTAKQTKCDAENGGYSGCNRTVCNWEAANEICSKFTYGGKSWRLPTINEISNWGIYSIGLGQNGLMLCDASVGYSSAGCQVYEGCYGSQTNFCLARRVWTSSSSKSEASAASLDSARYTIAAHSIQYPYGVRCVTEMD